MTRYPKWPVSISHCMGGQVEDYGYHFRLRWLRSEAGNVGDGRKKKKCEKYYERRVKQRWELIRYES